MATLEWWWRSHASFSLSLDDAVFPSSTRAPYFSPNATILTRLWQCNPRWQLLLCLSISCLAGQLASLPDFQRDLLDAPTPCNCSSSSCLLNATQLLGDDCGWEARRCELGRQAGAAVGALLLTMIADRRGRKVTTLVLAVCAIGLALALVLTASRDRYFVLSAFLGLFAAVPALTGAVWAIEFVPPTRRAVLALLMMTSGALHRLWLGLMVWGVSLQAAALTAVLAPIPGVLILAPLANESLGFLIAKNKYKSVKKIIRQRADRVNRTRFPLAEVESLQRRADATAHYLDDEEELFGGPPYLSALGKQYNLYDLLHSPRLLAWSLLLLSLWSLLALLRHICRASLPVASDSHEVLTRFLLSACARLAACLLGAGLMLAMGGRAKLLLVFALILLAPLSVGLAWTAFPALALLHAGLSAFTRAGLVLLCVEVYPTSMRCLGLGLNAAAAQLVSLLCLAAEPGIHVLAIAAAAVSLPFLALFLRAFPDTRAIPLPESLYEIEQWSVPDPPLSRCLNKLTRMRRRGEPESDEQIA